MAKTKETFQPTPVFVGSYTNITTCMVVFDYIRYIVPDVISAIELTFYTFFALNAKYPSDSEQIWLFLQQAVFGIKLPGDGKRNGMSITKLLCKCAHFGTLKQ